MGQLPGFLQQRIELPVCILDRGRIQSGRRRAQPIEQGQAFEQMLMGEEKIASGGAPLGAANRAEIARRITAVAQKMNISTVAVYSDADAALPFVREAAEAIRIGPAPAKESYLNAAAIFDAAKKTGAEAIHPGYGFLSESGEFARACRALGLVFVGPPADAMTKMKDKSEARRIVSAAGVPVAPGSESTLPTASAAAQEAERIGFPVLCKAAGGGGGIGMAVARNLGEVEKD